MVEGEITPWEWTINKVHPSDAALLLSKPRWIELGCERSELLFLTNLTSPNWALEYIAEEKRWFAPAGLGARERRLGKVII